MHQNLKHFIKLLVQSIVFWTLAMFCYAVFRYYGLDQEIAIALKKGFDDYDSVVQPLVIFTSIGFGLGILYALIDYLFEKYVP